MGVPDEIVNVADVIAAAKVVAGLPGTIISVNHFGGGSLTVVVYPWALEKIAPAGDWQIIETSPFWNDGQPKRYRYEAQLTLDGVRFLSLLDESQVPAGAALPASIPVQLPSAVQALPA